MSHIIDEIILHFSQFLLPECCYDSKNKSNQHYHRKSKRGDHEPYRTENIIAFCRKIYFQIIKSVRRIVRKKNLSE